MIYIIFFYTFERFLSSRTQNLDSQNLYIRRSNKHITSISMYNLKSYTHNLKEAKICTCTSSKNLII
ncbi:hypothetical protein Hanom_Chr15g01409861 [Helianthus anomalus]